MKTQEITVGGYTYTCDGLSEAEAFVVVPAGLPFPALLTRFQIKGKPMYVKKVILETVHGRKRELTENPRTYRCIFQAALSG